MRNIMWIARLVCVTAAVALAMSALPVGAATGPSVQVENGPNPALGTVSLEARELWRIGGTDSDHIFGVIARAFTDRDGNVYFVDSQLSEVQVYSATGAYLRTLSREGEGPGEVRWPLDGCWLPDGTLGIVQPYPGSVVKLHPDGTSAGSISCSAGQGGFMTLLRALGGGDSFALGGIRITYGQDGRGKETRFLSLWGADGTERQCLVRKETSVDYNNYGLDELSQDFAWSRCDIGSGGQLAVAPERNTYRIEVYDPNGTLVRVITRPYRSFTRTEDLRKIARSLLEAYSRHIPNVQPDITVADSEPDIISLRVMDDGALWARTSRGDWDAPAGRLMVFDVFGPDGRFLQQAALTCPGDLREDDIFLLSAERLIRVEGGADAALAQMGASKPGGQAEGSENPLEIVCYDISR
jgi:hypothetical protein